MKKIILMFLLIAPISFAQSFEFGEAKGLFMSVGVGPRFPIGYFGSRNSIGIGFDVNFSYTDNVWLPVFLYTSLGYQNYSGRQDLYKTSDYSSYSSNVIIVKSGVRFYFPPLIENVVLLMPIVDAGLEYGFFENFHQFKVDRNIPSYVEQQGKFGFHLGGGFSMFILDVITYYNYLYKNQYISFDIKANIPIFVTM